MKGRQMKLAAGLLAGSIHIDQAPGRMSVITAWSQGAMTMLVNLAGRGGVSESIQQNGRIFYKGNLDKRLAR